RGQALVVVTRQPDEVYRRLWWFLDGHALALLFHDGLGDPAPSERQAITVRDGCELGGGLGRLSHEDLRHLGVAVIRDVVDTRKFLDEALVLLSEGQGAQPQVVRLAATPLELRARLRHGRVSRAIGDDANLGAGRLVEDGFGDERARVVVLTRQ